MGRQPEAIGNLASKYPDKAIKVIPNLLPNTVENKINTTVNDDALPIVFLKLQNTTLMRKKTHPPNRGDHKERKK